MRFFCDCDKLFFVKIFTAVGELELYRHDVVLRMRFCKKIYYLG